MDQVETTERLPALDSPRRFRYEKASGRRRGGRGRRRALRIAAVGAVGVGVVVALWAVDTNSSSGEVARNVTLAGRKIARMTPAEVDAAVAELAAQYREAEVEVEAPDGGFRATAAELGLSVVEDATAAEAMAVGRRGSVPARIWGWARSFVAERQAPVRITVDEKAMARVVTERDPRRTPPVEPSVTAKDDKMVAKPGEPGRGISSPSVLAALQEAGPKGLPLRVSVDRDAVPPRFPIEEAQRLADRAEQLSAGGLPVSAGPATATVPASVVRGWFRTEPAGEELKLTVDASSAPDALAELFPRPVVAPVDAGFTVSGGRVSITASKVGTGCCAPGAVGVIQSALLSRSPDDAGTVNLPLKTVAPNRDEDDARRLGINEPVGTFTTNHAAGEPRVRNIHRIADIIQGAVIAPGATFSVNDFVGRRTVEKGFVPAPIIDENYKFTDDVGGGISQFATTIFNAAFFAGLDIPSYYMHGIYISRYPYGRESTISYPVPDVKIRNNTPHGVLIWPTYTSTSITVTLYSTRYVTGEQSGLTTERKGVCTVVTTERTRTYVDGRKTTDTFSGVYSPSEGVKCD
ncbi:MAG: VanW family protein [Actinomycetota bacterium]|nr:VanW family protein [Actinomycetota bacterium]